jgi:hypothetical protein
MIRNLRYCHKLLFASLKIQLIDALIKKKLTEFFPHFLKFDNILAEWLYIAVYRG